MHEAHTEQALEDPEISARKQEEAHVDPLPSRKGSQNVLDLIVCSA